MSWSLKAYTGAVRLGLPLATLATYFGFRRRSPDWHLARKIQPMEPLVEPENIKLWIHGASVGEASMMNRLLDWIGELGTSRERILVTTQTRSGLEQVDGYPKRLLPLDDPALLRPTVRTLPDELPLAVVETELWPNLYHLFPGRVSLVNARLKQRTDDRYRWVEPLIRETMSNCRRLLCRTEDDRRRLSYYLDQPELATVAGSLKWTALLDEPPGIPDRIPRFSEGNVLVGGSTHPGEEEVLLRTIRRTGENLYLAPRHLDRVEEVAESARDQGFNPRFTSEYTGSVEGNLVIVDEIGILSGLYGLGDRAFVGGSINPNVGGHNVFEPVLHGVPTVIGPEGYEIRENVTFLQDQGLISIVADEDGLVEHYRDRAGEKFATKLSTARKEVRSIQDRYRDHLQELLSCEL